MLNCDKYRRMHWSCTILYRESCRTIWEPKHPEHTGYTPGALVPSLVLAGRLYRVYHGTYKVLRGWIMYRNMNITKLYQSHRAGFSGIFNQCIIFYYSSFLRHNIHIIIQCHKNHIFCTLYIILERPKFKIYVKPLFSLKFRKLSVFLINFHLINVRSWNHLHMFDNTWVNLALFRPRLCNALD